MKGILRTMLCQFTFRNYRSYRDETELSKQATSMREFERSLIECPDGQSFLPVAAVYGPTLAASLTCSRLLTIFVRRWQGRSDCCLPALMRQKVTDLQYPVALR